MPIFCHIWQKNGTFWEMSTENDPKPQNIGYLRVFYEKKSKKKSIRILGTMCVKMPSQISSV